MTQAAWTYELPPTGAAAEIVDDYEARTTDGDHLGIVAGLVQHRGELYVIVDAGRLPPFLHRRLAVSLRDVAEVDHGALTVTVAGDRGRFDRTALVLDPAGAQHVPSAEAPRVHDLPATLASSVVPGREGPVEQAAALAVIAAGTLSAYSLLAVVAVWAARGLAGWAYLALVVPLLFALVGVVAGGYRLYREPHVGHHAQQTTRPAIT